MKYKILCQNLHLVDCNAPLCSQLSVEINDKFPSNCQFFLVILMLLVVLM